MQDTIQTRLEREGITLPDMAAPAANYLPFVRTGNLVFTAGQLPFVNGQLHQTGLLGRDVEVEEGRAAARQCAINILAVIKAAVGDLEKVERIVKLTAFVASAPGFTDQPKVANGASDLLVSIFGEKGRHARSAVGMASLPLDAPVEVEAVIEVSA